MNVIYKDKDFLVINKPAGIDVIALGEELSKKYSELGNVQRNGIIHRLDKDTSGLILAAKNEETLIFFQKQFKNREVEKKYIALAAGTITQNEGKIETLIGRSKKDGKKQKVYLKTEPNVKNKREAVTEYKVIKKYKDYTLLEISLKTGRKHQIRCHLAYIGHPIAGDKMYGFKNQSCPAELNRQFLHAAYLKIKMPSGGSKKFRSRLPKELKKVIENL